ncbi:rhamnogalacturonan acetylesterase [Pedobacter endophyticus]|uniref:Rhamnogalacturonan acetylesterase n=1 Tax=Pedobacter endophyticus TaxID=2789740 RepID=A0A7U3Q4N3_9SPHI|nr:rhamnogalacturonan acetylesterase [Pedobacter endophyticus]QPH38249.1 rhamnogalacturonan acetylesterase [Pedobacter endophyticus]
MKNYRFLFASFIILTLTMSFIIKPKPVKVYLIGDSTVADYSLEPDYMQKKYPITGWGQVFQQFLQKDSLKNLNKLIRSDSALVIDKAKGGRSTRTFFEEGRWKEVLDSLKKNDLVLIQFGHNDAAKNKPERYVDIPGYKDFLRMYVKETKAKGAIPILLTPVARNSPWKEGKLLNAHTDYPQAVKDVAAELKVKMIDLNELSANFFTSKGREFSAKNYFMNLDSGKFVAYPKGQKDNTHFQPEGAKEIARLVYEGLKKINEGD